MWIHIDSNPKYLSIFSSEMSKIDIHNWRKRQVISLKIIFASIWRCRLRIHTFFYSTQEKKTDLVGLGSASLVTNTSGGIWRVYGLGKWSFTPTENSRRARTYFVCFFGSKMQPSEPISKSAIFPGCARQEARKDGFFLTKLLGSVWKVNNRNWNFNIYRVT